MLVGNKLSRLRRAADTMAHHIPIGVRGEANETIELEYGKSAAGRLVARSCMSRVFCSECASKRAATDGARQ